jgi:N-acetylglucosaminyldiphosphoundecaprenol N-acetyl-beta-D-mannosaminyltransferase
VCKRVELLGVAIDPLSMDQAAGQIQAWLGAGDSKCRYVVTTHVHHVVLLQQHAGLQAAFAQAGLILAGDAPLIWASQLLGKRLPGRVAGADLIPALLDAASAESPTKVFLLVSAPDVADRAAAHVHRRWPGVRVVGTYSPPQGFENDRAENLRILARIADARPDLVVLGLNAPRQELWVHQHRSQIKARVVLCAGKAIDVLAGAQPQPPAWMRELGLDWLHRVLREPWRLAGRYARDAWVFPQLVAREWWQNARRPLRAS